MDLAEASLEAQGAAVALRWRNGRVQRLSAPFLRAVCQCAECGNLAIKIEPKMFPGLTVRAVYAVGGYALQFVFSDGHQDGAYPFEMLERLPDDM
jgi:DUF971 family protein